MKALKDMLTIQIDITNACDKACSNCTRFCGNHKKPFYMDYPTFTRAFDSLDGYIGVKGLIGGEPTLHPEFVRFSQYIKEKSEKKICKNRLIEPQLDFIKEIRRREFESHKSIGKNNQERYAAVVAGLWSNMGRSYRKYYEIINDVYDVQFLNDHLNPVYHQPALISRKDLNIPDDKWLELRDNCWIQNNWSATITPKGAFFCEIAGTLDMLFDGPGGWKIEQGWWEREPKDFGEQLRWCEICGFALYTFMRDSAEEIDDVSPTLYEMLKKVGSPRLKAGKVNLIEIENGKISEKSKAKGQHFSEAMPYIEKYEDRFNEMNSILFLENFDEICIDDGDNFGIELNKELKKADEWIVWHNSKTEIPLNLKEKLSRYVLNPGTLHYSNGVALFSKNALSLKEFGFDRVSHTKTFQEIIDMWQPNKIVGLTDDWNNTYYQGNLQSGVNYAVWGTGLAGGAIAYEIELSGGNMVAVFDIAESKHGQNFYGKIIQSPNNILNEQFEYLIVANYTKFNEIKEMAKKLGVEENRILLIDEL